MNMLEKKEIFLLENILEIEKKILFFQKALFEIKLKSVQQKQKKSHYFSSYKRIIAQLKMRLNQINNKKI